MDASIHAPMKFVTIFLCVNIITIFRVRIVYAFSHTLVDWSTHTLVDCVDQSTRVCVNWSINGHDVIKNVY